jgi:uncharacterized protein (DUF1778 family)
MTNNSRSKGDPRPKGKKKPFEVVGQFKVTPEQKDLLESAAKKEGRSVAGYVRFHAIAAAEKISK